MSFRFDVKTDRGGVRTPSGERAGRNVGGLLAHVEGELRVAALIADQSAEEAGLAAENHLIPTVHESRWLSAAEKSRG